MKQKLAKQKTTQHTLPDLDQAPSAGSGGMAITPPLYRISSIDYRLAESTANNDTVFQRQVDVANNGIDPELRKENKTGLPVNLKAGIESLSGLALDDVRVHYNSAQPAHLNALAYTQGAEIHVAAGQERHLPHEAWHVVQQAQGRVRPTMQMKGVGAVNDNKGLEREADVMGAKAIGVWQAKRETERTAPSTLAPLFRSMPFPQNYAGRTGGTDGKVLQRKPKNPLEGFPYNPLTARLPLDDDSEEVDLSDDFDPSGDTDSDWQSTIEEERGENFARDNRDQEKEEASSRNQHSLEEDVEPLTIAHPRYNILTGGLGKDVARLVYSYFDNQSLAALARVSKQTKGFAESETLRRFFNFIEHEQVYLKFADMSKKDAKEKCETAAREIGQELKNRNVQHEYCGVLRWANLQDERPTNHYVVLALIGGKKVAIDATAQQFTGGKPTILLFEEWQEAFKGIIGNAPAKFVCGNFSMVRNFANQLYSPINYWDAEGEEINPVNSKMVKTAKKSLKSLETKRKRIELKNKAKRLLYRE